MKLLLVFALALAYVSADDRDATIIVQEQDISPDGGEFFYKYQTSNGISAEANGKTIAVDGGANTAQEVNGGYSYTAPDGQPIQLVYTAGVNGYNPQGNILPTPPPTPEGILRLLQFISARYNGPNQQ